MEQGIEEFAGSFLKLFGLERPDLKRYSPLTLAYIGDAVYELVIRSYTTCAGNAPAQKLHQKASSLVNAHTQSEMARALADHLTPEETDVYKRGRNARSYTRAKNASMSDYRRATGLEALVGYLYLDGSYDRLVELIHLGLTELSLI